MSDQDPFLTAVGEALRAMRKERRMTQEELALETGVHRNYIGGLERGERQPTVKTLAVLAAALRYRTSDVLLRAEARLDLAGRL